MAHVDDGTLNALLDGELREAEASAIRAHVAACAECSVRFEEAKRFLAAADDLLNLLTVPAAGEPQAHTSRPPTPAPEAPRSIPAAPAEPGMPGARETVPRRVPKTAREVAVDIDGATHQSPAILPNVPRAGEVVPPPRSPSTGVEIRPLLDGRPPRPTPAPHRRPDWATLAWAASVVLALGVGYLANEVRRLRPPASGNTQALAPRADSASTPAARAAESREPGQPAATGGAAADAFAAATPRPKPGGATSGKAVQPPAADAAPLALASGAAGVAGYRDQPAAAQLAPTPPARGRDAAAEPAGRADAGAPQRAAESAGFAATVPPAATPALAAAPRAAVAAPLTRLPARPAFRLSDMDAAAASLSGRLRTLAGLSVENVKIGPGALVPGAQPDRDVVRINYTDPQGRQLQLDQQRLPAPRDASREARAQAVPAVLGLAYGDTLSTEGPGGTTRVRWLDPAGLWLSLSGSLPADSLLALLARVR